MSNSVITCRLCGISFLRDHPGRRYCDFCRDGDGLGIPELGSKSLITVQKHGRTPENSLDVSIDTEFHSHEFRL